MIQPGIVVSHELAIRQLTVSSVRRLSPCFVRVTVTGSDLTGFTSSGPADHCKLYFPDAAAGTITAPVIVDGKVRRSESGTIVVRDYTPRAFRAEESSSAPELDFDFLLHGDDGPASAWAASVAVGDPLVIGGPRGSRLPPSGASQVVLVADETALPALARWIELLPDAVEIVAFATISDESDAAYLEPAHIQRARVVWLNKDPDSLERAVRAYGPISNDTFVWAAGEAGALIPIRRYLRRELALPAAQVVVAGYWKAGESGRDHHAPVDPADPGE